MSAQPSDYKHSPLWEKALQNYREELAGDDDYQIILETGTLEVLMNDAKTLRPVGPQGRKALDSMGRMKPMIKLVNDFAAVIAVAFGADAMLAAIIWGSIRMILTVGYQYSRQCRHDPRSNCLVVGVFHRKHTPGSVEHAGRAQFDLAAISSIRTGHTHERCSGDISACCVHRGYLLLRARHTLFSDSKER